MHYPTRYATWCATSTASSTTERGTPARATTNLLANVNLAKRDGGGRFVVAEALADLFYDAIVQHRALGRALHRHLLRSASSWTQTPAGQHRLRARGLPRRWPRSTPAWHAGHRHARRPAAPAVRARTAILVGNCAVGHQVRRRSTAGCARTSPTRTAAPGTRTCSATAGGYFGDEASFRAPTHNYIFTRRRRPPTRTRPTNTRKVRFGLGSAALGDGLRRLRLQRTTATSTAPYHRWWYDEYAVDLATGRASSAARRTPAGSGRRSAAVPDDLGRQRPRRGHEPGLREPTSRTAGRSGRRTRSPASVTRDATTSAVGAPRPTSTSPPRAPSDWHVIVRHAPGR